MKRVWIPALVVIAACCFLAGRSAGSADGLPATPQIIRRVELTNQTAPIPTTTLFTPSHNGLYRISMYLTGTSGDAGWAGYLTWSDDAGFEDTSVRGVIATSGGPPPQAWGTSYGETPGSVSIIEAVAGQPVSYNVIIQNADTSGTYSLYIIVERLAP